MKKIHFDVKLGKTKFLPTINITHRLTILHWIFAVFEFENQEPAPVCERRETISSLTGTLTYILVPCPEWIQDLEIRVPAYCCGIEGQERKCCDWTTYIVNRVGFGRTGVG